jgi:hypothetical protein
LWQVSTKQPDACFVTQECEVPYQTPNARINRRAINVEFESGADCESLIQHARATYGAYLDNQNLSHVHLPKIIDGCLSNLLPQMSKFANYLAGVAKILRSVFCIFGKLPHKPC